jgi:hypothetical protein
MSLSTTGATIARALAAALIRHLLTGLGATLAAHGFVDAGTVDHLIPPLAEEIIGVALVAIALAWSAVRARVGRLGAPLMNRLRLSVLAGVAALASLTSGCAAPRPTSAGEIAVAARVTLEEIVGRYARAKTVLEIFLPFMPPEHAARVRAIGAEVDRYLALAQAATSIAERATAIADAEAAMNRFGVAAGS